MKKKSRSVFRCRSILLLVALAMFAATAAFGQIVRDNTDGQSNTGALVLDNDVYTINGDDGVKRDTTVLHSFTDFQLRANETARYDDNANDLATIRNVITRITGGDPSQLDGRIESLYPNAEMLFMNPNGVFFGSGFTLDVQQGFHVSTADFLSLQDSVLGEVIVSSGAAGLQEVLPELTMATPDAWGFLEANPQGLIDVQGFNAAGINDSAIRNTWSFVAGDVTIGTDATPIIIETEGRSFNAVAIGDIEGRVKGFASNPAADTLSLDVSTLAGAPLLPDGQLTIRGTINTIRTDNNVPLNGGVALWGGSLDFGGLGFQIGDIETGSDSEPQQGGSVWIFGNDILMDMDIDTSSEFLDAGNVRFVAENTLEFAGGNNIDAAATTAGTQSGLVDLVAPSIIGDGLDIFLGDAGTFGDGNTISMTGDTIFYNDSSLEAVTNGTATASNVVVIGNDVEFGDDTVIDVSTTGSAAVGGSILANGTDRLDVDQTSFVTTASGTGNAGDITLRTNNLEGQVTVNYDPSATGGGADGIVTIDAPGNDQIIRDTTGFATPIPLIPDANGVFTIHGNNGTSRDGGKLILHSFSDFSLNSGDTALYTDDAAGLGLVENVLTRVTGSNSSQLDGTIQSDYLNADLTFVNNNGVFFGSGFTLDVKQGFHVSTADFLEIRNDLGQVTQLDMTTPEAFPGLNDNVELFAWGFLDFGAEKTIDVAGFDVDLTEIISPDKVISFVGSGIVLGSDQELIDLNTNGRGLNVIAIGSTGRVESFTAPSSAGQIIPTVTDLQGVAQTAFGDITLRAATGINTGGNTNRNGDVLFMGEVLDLFAQAGGGISTRGDALFAQEAGDVSLIGEDITLDMNIDTRSNQLDAGNVFVNAFETMNIGSATKRDSISTGANAVGMQSGFVQLGVSNPGGSLTANRVEINASVGGTRGDAQFVSINADNLDLANSQIFGNTSGTATPIDVGISGVDVDLSVLEIFARTSEAGDGAPGAVINLTGTNSLNVTNGFFSTLAIGNFGPSGDGGDITVTSPNIIGFAPGLFDLRSVTGQDGILTINAPLGGGIFRDDTDGQASGDIIPDNGVYTILGDEGIRRDNGRLILHSFTDFNLDAGETALYTDNTSLTDARSIITRVTGNNASQIDGTIVSDYMNADLYFVNNNGVFFGQNFAIDVNQSFHTSTGDSLEMRDGLIGPITTLDMTSAEDVPDVTLGDVHAVGFLSQSPAAITVAGFDATDSNGANADNEFAFIGGDVIFGTDQQPTNINTNGRTLIAVAMGRDGRVVDDPVLGGDTFELQTTDLNGEPVLPEGSITLRGDIDTSGIDLLNGDVFLWGGDLDLRNGTISTRANNGFSQDAGDVVLFGTDIVLRMDIDTRSTLLDAGDVIINGFNTLDFGSNNTVYSIDTTASEFGARSGVVALISGNSLDVNNVEITTGDGVALGDGQGILLTAPNLTFTDSDINGMTAGDAEAQTVSITGTNVDISGTTADLSTQGSTTDGGILVIQGSGELNVSGAFGSVAANGAGNGGTVVIDTGDFINDGTGDLDLSANGGGDPGTLLFNGVLTDPNDLPISNVPAPPPDVDPNDIVPQIQTLEQLISVELIDEPSNDTLSDPIGFGDLQPAEPGGEVASSSPEGDEDSDDESASTEIVAASTAGRTSSGGGAPAESPTEDPATEALEEQVALATATTEAESRKKSSSVPGVSLFTNVSQRSPLVPRTCESIDGGKNKSRLLARSNKRLPTSPEDWLIAFDSSGDRLLAAADNPELPAVAAIGSSGENLEQVERSVRTQRALASAAAAVRGGRYDDASAGFEQAVNDLEGGGDLRGASEALLAYAQLQLTDGRFIAARGSLERSLALAEPLGDEQLTASVRTSLGNALIGTGDLVRAEAELTRGLNIVLASSDEEPAASALNNLGNRHAATRDFESALWAYERSATLARKLGRTGDEARALSGAARAAADSGHLTDARKLLDQAMPLVDALPDARERVPLYIHMGSTFAQFAASSPAARPASLMSAYTAFDAALKGAEKLGDLRAVALANLNLGALYRDEQYRSEALYLTRLARRAAEAENAPELLYRAHWQEGQILWSEHQLSAALASHRRAVEILEETKPVASDGYGSSDTNFRGAVGGVYQDTVDLLLQSASLAREERTSDLLVAEARDTLEKLKAAELRDYFEDECIANVSGEGRDIDKLGGKAAVVYVVTLPDRIELLVGLPTGIERFTSKVSAPRVAKTVDQFRAAVQNPLSNKHHALGRKIYDWTVAPYAERIAELGIETLVFIPDGRLRTLPFAALSDGEHYLSERYATATALSLRLLTSQDVLSESGRPVLAGVSESVQGFSALAAVDSELAEIREIEGDGELFLNEAFTLDEIRSAVEREVPGIVHLATHAVFTGNPDTSFLLTYDGRVGFDDLSDVVGMTRADGAPLDLLVLSACETAVGNDRAGLGFTGSAIRAGARSALGSLWPISDTAARALMIDFYKGLQSPDVSKAEALRKAQATLRDSERFSHPFYWAPFTLVNDWM